MSNLVAFFGNDPERVECALFPARLALTSKIKPGEPNGWGLGFAQAGDVLLQKRPRSDAPEVDFYALAKTLRADALIGRAGLNEEARLSADNADPFRFRWWMFGGIGEAAGFEAVRDSLLESIPDFLRRNIRGRSPSEHVFHVFLAFLHDAGLLESMSAPPDAVARGLRESAGLVNRHLVEAGVGPLRMALAATNGRCLVAQSTGAHPLQFLEINGIPDCTICREKNDIEGHDRRIAHEGLRAVIVEANDGHPVRPGWRGVPENASIVVGADRVPRILTA